MRTIVSGILAATAYWILIAAFLAVSMPTRAQVEAYIEAAMTAAPSQTSHPPLG